MSLALRHLAIPCVAIASLALGCGDKPAAPGEAADPVTALDASKAHIAKLAVDRFAFSDMPQWQLLTNKQCPDSLQALAKETARDPTEVIDPWGTPYELLCGEKLPPEATGNPVAVLSYGPDRKQGTGDDIKSWKPIQGSSGSASAGRR